MKRFLCTALTALLAVSLLALPVGAEEDHVHQWSKEWSYDNSAHWHECTAPDCPITDNREKAGYGEHNGQWTIERTATERSSGLRYQECPTCNHYICDLTPASLPTADSYTLDLRKGPVTLSGDEMEALLNAMWDLPDVRMDDICMQGLPDGYHVILGRDRKGYALDIRFHYGPVRPDAPPDRVESITCAVRPGIQGTFTAQIPEDRLSTRLKSGNPIFGSLTIRLGYEPWDLTDLEGHWAETNVAQAVTQGWVNGYPDGTFRPQRTISRAEMTKMLLAATGLVPESEAAQWMRETAPKGAASFTDMEKNWLTTQGWTGTALVAGLLLPSEYPEGKFLPDQAITRGEIAVLTVRALGLAGPAGRKTAEQSSFADRDSFLPEQAGPIREAAQAGIINGYSDGTFGPELTATRAEAVTMVARTLAVMHEGDNTALPEGERIALHLRSPSLPDDLAPDDLSGYCQIVDGLVYADLTAMAINIRILADDIQTIFKTILTWTPADQSFSIQTEDRLFVFTAGETAYTIDGSPRTFPAPVRMRNGNLLIPLYDLDSGTPCGPWTVSWEGTSRTLSIPAVWPAG